MYVAHCEPGEREILAPGLGMGYDRVEGALDVHSSIKKHNDSSDQEESAWKEQTPSALSCAPKHIGMNLTHHLSRTLLQSLHK
jgi:hypothetical protein